MYNASWQSIIPNIKTFWCMTAEKSVTKSCMFTGYFQSVGKQVGLKYAYNIQCIMTKQNVKYQIILIHVSWGKPNEKLYVTQYYTKFQTIGKQEVEDCQVWKTLTTYYASWQNQISKHSDVCKVRKVWRKIVCLQGIMYVTQYYTKVQSFDKQEVEGCQVWKTLTTYNAAWQSKMPNIKSF